VAPASAITSVADYIAEANFSAETFTEGSEGKEEAAEL
jgi:hypothetical protein